MAGPATPRLARLIGLVAIFVVVGTPMVAYIWETLNVLLTGRVEPLRLGIALIIIAIFAGLLKVLSRSIHAVEGRRDELPGANPPSPAPPQSPTRRPS